MTDGVVGTVAHGDRRLWGRRLLAWLGVALVVAACGADRTRGPVAILEGRLDGPTTLVLNVSTCGGNPEVAELQETSTEVRVEIVSTDVSEGPACADGIEVPLASPLADREVIDLTSGDQVTLP